MECVEGVLGQLVGAPAVGDVEDPPFEPRVVGDGRPVHEPGVGSRSRYDRGEEDEQGEESHEDAHTHWVRRGVLVSLPLVLRQAVRVPTVRHVLVIDPDGALPPYEQVRNQLAERIDTGELAPGERLPTVRGLATELGLAANTVARAYRELEQAGIVATRGRKGTFVVDAADQPWRRDAEAAAEAYAARLRELGVPTGVGIELATRAIEEPPG